MKVELRAYAKANLYLKVNGLDNRSYHDITTFKASINIFDEVAIKFRNDLKVSVLMDKTINEKNNALKVAEYLSKLYSIGVDISIKKKIPISAGLGGSSADTAAVIYGFWLMLKIEKDEKYKFPSFDSFIEFGDDVPFMLKGGIDTGCDFDSIKAMSALLKYKMVLIKPKFGLNTKDVFKKYDDLKKHDSFNISIKHDIKKLCLSIENFDEKGIKENMVNDLYFAAYDLKNEVAEIKKELLEKGAITVVMSGSGSSFIGLFREDEYVDLNLFKDKYEFADIIEIVEKPIQVFNIDKGV